MGGIAGLATFAFVVGAVTVVLWERRRHQRATRLGNDLSRSMSTYHRTRLSVDGNNYSHVAPPRTSLRRSAHLPYGVVSEGWADLPSQESLSRQQMAAINERDGEEEEQPQPKRRRSLRKTFSPYSFSVPKTRRQRKLDKTIPLGSLARSPLSAITEFSDPNTSTREVSPSMLIAEMPTETTPKPTPPSINQENYPPRPLPTAWPLAVTKRKSQDVGPITADTRKDRNTTIMRMNSTGHSMAPNRPSMGQRSISMSSSMSSAPEGPLPPLPIKMAPSTKLQRRSSNIRSSVASTTTVDSSVLGNTIFSASKDGSEDSSLTRASPRLELERHEQQTHSWEPSTMTMGMSPGRQKKHSYRNGIANVSSLRASNGINSLLRAASTSRANEGRTRDTSLQQSDLATIDASSWNPDLSIRNGSFRKSLSPSLPAPIARPGPAFGARSVSKRHSMYEQLNGSGTFSNPFLVQDSSRSNDASGRRPSQPRPASVASSNSFQWDSHIVSNGRDASVRGHKRQNCVRITNLPPVDMSRRNSKLPQMTEEEEEQLEEPAVKNAAIPGLALIQPEDEMVIRRISQRELQPSPSPSPFRNRPILNPTSRLRRPTWSRASSTEDCDSPRPDSDVFGSQYDPKTPILFGASTPEKAWPLTPTPASNIKLNQQTPSRLNPISEPYDPESPILPSPTLLSAALFPNNPRSGIKGPRAPPSTYSNRSSRNASPSPIIARQKQSADDLRRSVMLLRRMNSDTLNKDCVSKIYRNIADEYRASSSSVQSVASTAKAMRSPSIVEVSPRASPRASSQMTKPPSERPGVERFVTAPEEPAGLLTVNEKRQTSSAMRNSSSMRNSTSKMGFGPSPSMSGASIWEDASVWGDSPELELPVLEEDEPALSFIDEEAYGEFVGQENLTREVSPQGKGLGVMVGGRPWGTPGSLYDREGFLKDSSRR